MNGLAQSTARYEETRIAKDVSGPTLLGEIASDVSMAASLAYQLANRMREFNDGVLGSQPQADGTKGLAKASIPTRGESLRGEVRSLNEALGMLQTEVNRLDRI